MTTYLIISVLFGITVVLAFLEDRLKEGHKMSILIGYALFMILLVTTKDVEHTADASVYENMFYRHDELFFRLTLEPTFIYLSKIVMALGGGIGVMFFIYAVLSIPNKLKILYNITPYIFTALIIYIPVYFELHDMVQMRVSAAAMFLLASLIPLSKKQYWQAALLIVGGILFHYSAVVYLPFLFIGNRKLNTIARIVIAALLPICFAMYLLKIDWFSIIPAFSATIGYKLESYKETAEKGQWEELYPLYMNLYYLSKCAMLCLCLYFYDYLTEKIRIAPLLISLFAASTLFLPSMATIPVVAGRISDLFGLVDCIVFTFLLYLIEPKYLARIAITIVGFYMLIYNMVFAEYFT